VINCGVNFLKKMKKKTLVFGASLKSSRYSNLTIQKLRAKNIEVKAFGIQAGIVVDVFIETEKIMFQNIDTITMYMNSKRQAQYYDYIISLQPKRVIFNPGAENPEFVEKLGDCQILTENTCTLVRLSLNTY